MSLDPLTDALVTTDQADYAPGSTATITATGFGIGDPLQFEISVIDPATGAVLWSAPTWQVADDADGLADGMVTTNFYVTSAYANTTIQLTVTDLTTGEAATTVFTDGAPPADIDDPSDVLNVTAHGTTPVDSGIVNGALFQKVLDTGTGTGNFNSFLRIQGHTQDTDDDSGTEKGFNTNADPLPLDDVSSDQHTHAIRLQDLNTETVGGIEYRVFVLDIGQSGNDESSKSYLSLDALKIFSASTPDIGGDLANLAGLAAPVYDLGLGEGQFIGLEDLHAGNGQDDYRVLIPETFFAGVQDQDYIYLYSEFGYHGDGWEANSTFEEWGTGPAPFVPHPSWDFFKDVTTVGDDTEGGCDPTAVHEDHGTIAGPGDAVIDHAGQQIEYTVTLHNDGNVAINDITVTDSLAGNLQTPDQGDINGIDVESSGNADNVLDPGEIWTWTYTYTVTQADVDGNGNALFDFDGVGPADPVGVIQNTATVHTDDTNVNTVIPNDVALSTDVAVCWDPSWDFFKDVTAVGDDTEGGCDPTAVHEDHGTIAGPGDAVIDHAGQEITYVVTLHNDGNVAIHDVTVTDSLAGNLQTPDQGDINGIDVESSGNADDVLDPGEIWTWTYTYTVTQADIDGNGNALFDFDGVGPADPVGVIQNTATVHTGDTNVNTVIPNDVALSTDIAVCQDPAVTIEKNILCHDEVLAADPSVNLLKDGDGKVTYQIIVSNTGNVTIGDPVVTDTGFNLANATLVESGSGTHGDGILDVGETWTYTYDSAWAAGSHTNTAEVQSASWSLDQSDSAIYFGLNPHITLDKKTNGVDSAQVLVGQAVTWTYYVTNDGNVDNLIGLAVTDSPSQTITQVVAGGFNVGDTNTDGNLDIGETWQFKATGTAGSTNYTNTATATTNAVSDDCGDSVTPTATDSSSYTPHANAQAGLTKGYWGTHFTIWDVKTGDEKADGPELNNFPGGTSGIVCDWNHDGSKTQSTVTTSTGSTNGMVDISKGGNGCGDSGLLMGDLNHDGKGTGDSGSAHIFFDLASAQALLNSSVTSDARIILAGQAIAAQLNEYQGFVKYGADTSPDGLISEAVQWLLGQGPLSPTHKSAVNSSTSNDLLSPAVVEIIDIGKTNGASWDYTLSGGAITLKSAAMSSSDASWQTKAQVFSESAAGLDINNDGDTHDTVWANGEGLKNALAAYNHGLTGSTAGFVVSTDGTLIGWQDSLNGAPYDVHSNDPDVFWGILANHSITGVEWHLAP